MKKLLFMLAIMLISFSLVRAQGSISFVVGNQFQENGLSAVAFGNKELIKKQLSTKEGWNKKIICPTCDSGQTETFFPALFSGFYYGDSYTIVSMDGDGSDNICIVYQGGSRLGKIFSPRKQERNLYIANTNWLDTKEIAGFWLREDGWGGYFVTDDNGYLKIPDYPIDKVRPMTGEEIRKFDKQILDLFEAIIAANSSGSNVYNTDK
jgi:hypothetical protein